MIYVRTISIYRPSPPVNEQGGLQVGDAGYAGMQAPSGSNPGNEALVFSGFPASIQAEALGNTRQADVPASAPGPTKWSVYLPKSVPATYGDIKDRDIIVDDVGDRYQVASAYRNNLGWKLLTIRLEA